MTRASIPVARAHACTRWRPRRAFTIVEMLVAMTLLVIISGVVIAITNQTSRIWLDSSSRIQTFQESRAGFEAVSRTVSQATLNTYYDYYDSNNVARSRVASGLSGTSALSALANFTPATYDRYSDLHFICGQTGAFKLQVSGSDASQIVTQTHAIFFQAPLGYSASPAYQSLETSLNACGYFLLYSDANESIPPHILKSKSYVPRYRFRLMEMLQPTEKLAVTTATGNSAQNDWFVKNAVGSSRIIAENVIAFVLLPKLPFSQDDPAGAGKGVSLAPAFNYNSRIPLKAAADPSYASFPSDAFTSYPMAGGTVNGTRHAMLPPVVKLVMVVIDETSAARIQGRGTTLPDGINFAKTTLFTNAGNLDSDLRKVEDICNAKKGNLTGNTVRLTYRIFSTDIIMRNAKWSNN